VVADNGSTDDSVLFIENSYPQVEIIRLEKNFGFAKGYNEALKQVESDYYFILNSDVELLPRSLKPLVDLLETDKMIAACQPKLLTWSNKKLFEYAGGAGGWLDKYGYPFAKGRIFDVFEEDNGQYDKSEPIFWASGAALFIRASVFHEVKGFDEFFFAHQEEIDLCWRIQLAGYKIYSCPSSVVYHVGGGTLPKGNSLKVFLNFRNNLIMLSKNLPFWRAFFVIGFRFALDNISALKGLLSGDAGYFKAIIKAHFAYQLIGLLSGQCGLAAFRKKEEIFQRDCGQIRFLFCPEPLFLQHKTELWLIKTNSTRNSKKYRTATLLIAGYQLPALYSTCLFLLW
jgi:GT2 family glycosyltransferase